MALLQQPLQIGLELGDHTLKLVWAAKTPGGRMAWGLRKQQRRHPATKDSKNEPFDSALPRSGRVLSLSKDELLEDIKELLRPFHRQRFRVHLILAAPHSYLRQLVLRVSDEKQIPKTLGPQLPALFPFDVQRAQIRHVVQQRQKSEDQLHCTLSVVACEGEALQSELEVLWQAGWVPASVVPSAVALAALVLNQNQALASESSVLLLDFGARRSTMGLLVNGQLLFAREVSIGSNDLTEALMSEVVVGEKTLRLSWQEAEAIKCQRGLAALDPSGFDAEALPVAMYEAMVQPILEEWLGEIQRTVAFGLKVPMGSPPTLQRIMLSGGASQLPGLDAWLSRQMNLPVSRLTVQPLLGDGGPEYAVPCGLLLSQERIGLPGLAVNLLPEKSRWIRRLVAMERLAILVLLVLFMLVGIGILSTHLRLKPLSSQLAKVEHRAQELTGVTQLAQSLEVYSGFLDSVTGANAPVSWLQSLSQGFPDPVRLTQLSLDEPAAVKMTGEVEARDQAPEAYVSELIMWLTQKRLCKTVHLESSQRNTVDASLVNFQLTCQR
ncbi:MAG: pilus assembly protein PilM [Candidatus Omnitrophica bacterium]|nr:pilus assembly protein PilM [Candidatus Omnitrophota bacterium]